MDERKTYTREKTFRGRLNFQTECIFPSRRIQNHAYSFVIVLLTSITSLFLKKEPL